MGSQYTVTGGHFIDWLVIRQELRQRLFAPGVVNAVEDLVVDKNCWNRSKTQQVLLKLAESFKY